ncbi:MAG TPA: hypothetical protein VIY29_00435 [Ktedonobacteraceae bacterium]
METLKLIVAGIILTIAFCVLVWQVLDSYRKASDARRRAGELLRAVLTPEQYNQLMRRGYIDILSPRDQERTYRVPRGPGLVRVIDNGRQTASLCLQPLERVPDADIVVMHKLMIEADEETYLQKANRFAPLCISYRED